MKPTPHLFVAFLALILCFASVDAAPQYPEPTGFVNDYAQLLDGQERSQLESLLRQLQERSSIEFAFVTLDSIPEGQDISLYAVELGHAWGVGQSGSDKGALLLYKHGRGSDRQVYLATGYGLEGEINDARAGRILDEVTIPRLARGQIASAAAATALVVVSTAAPDVQLEDLAGGKVQGRLTPSSGSSEGPSLPSLIVMLVIFALLMSTRLGRTFLFGMMLSSMFGRRGGWGGGGFGGGGFGGGFGGFGGGGFGGGGAGRSF